MEIRAEHGTIGQILQNEQLAIPAYQRPYKWQRKQIRNLFYDSKEAQERESYQLGSLIVHQTSQSLDVVDGQQRLISIALFLYALGELNQFIGAKQLLSREVDELSVKNAQENLAEWRQLIALDEELARGICDFLLKQCQVFVITIPEERLSEAFQLFDSQNNRGKSLEPHDLLKAYHLRNIDKPTEQIISEWERVVDDEDLTLKALFDQHLFRMRRWSQGETGLTRKRNGSYLRFTEAYIDDFKGVTLGTDEETSFPYLKLYKELQKRGISLPKSLTMPIINGEFFFEYIAYAHQEVSKVLSYSYLEKQNLLSDDLKKILFKPKERLKRPRNLFQNLLALFVDRFGANQLTSEVVETLLVWSHYPLKQSRIFDATVGNYAASGRFRNQNDAVQKLFHVLANSSSPTDFLQQIDHDKFDNWTVKKVVEKVNER